MKKQLLFTCLLFLIGTTIYAKPETILDPPTATMAQDATICPGNVATITITGTPNCIALIRTSHPAPGGPSAFGINIGPSGTAVFTTPQLSQTTVYTLERVTEFLTGNFTIITGVTVTITVVPNGCTTVFTNSMSGSGNPLMSCNPGECHTLTATPTPVPSTTTYTVSSIPYCPQAAFTDPSYTQVNATSDDVWSPPIALPFNFSFFNQNFTSCQVGSNGLISFNAHEYPGFCDWNLNSMNIPNPTLANPNSIFGVFQDIDFRTDGGQSPADVSINYKVLGTYPCRKLVVNFYHAGQFQCNQTVGLQTYQIVLYELSNIIEVYVQNRTRCTGWEAGEGVIGIMNSTGTLGYTPPGRNTNDAWTASNEAWRFTPSGPNVPIFVRWLQDGNEIATGLSATVCPVQTTTYTTEANYIVSGVPYAVTSYSEVLVVNDQTQEPADLSVCYDTSGIYTADLTTNNPIILGGADPFDYDIAYFTSLADAENYANEITNPSLFSFTQNQTIYAGIVRNEYDCRYIKSFQLNILASVDAPTGISPQTLNAGQPLSSLIVTGQNIQWYDAPQGGNLLPGSTVAQNNVTYYATQTVNSCESRSVQSSRLAILVQLNLNNNEFDSNAFSIYPNPTSDVLTLTSNVADVKLDIFNILSQKIESRVIGSGNNTIDLSNFTSGIYLFQLSLDGKTKTYKIVKN
ncbi:T9SS type A sorting domain-containing protein [Flavobacterium wongokense]|uniref:T9SS type A sorting domain-containing protein n=1 Tax=Flavobacterium wongokense TaxID=2910674 RepID=UPI001F3C6B69|nr:T9SS type A sorting domain-containing protein [Flavobacterium sp. WG47]MCF6131920.1 T9SS type A sorting domain-containing protein [Flavobacterium sp. WG47]